MPVIGYNGPLNNSESSANNTQVHATKFVAPANFTPLGTCYVAIYSDNAGTPGTLIWSGSAPYTLLHGLTGFGGAANPLVIEMTSPPTLVSGTSYWLCVQTKNASGTYNIQNYSDNETGYEIKKWTASSSGTWDADPSITATVNNERLALSASDAVDVNSERDAKTAGKVASNAERGGFIAGGDGRYVEHFTNTDKKDTVNTDAEWPGDGTARLSES